MSETLRPEKCTNAMLTYLDRLRERGTTNMFGAVPYIKRAFPELTEKEARDVLLYWMETFGDRHPNG